jgi:hypothetical protein
MPHFNNKAASISTRNRDGCKQSAHADYFQMIFTSIGSHPSNSAFDPGKMGKFGGQHWPESAASDPAMSLEQTHFIKFVIEAGKKRKETIKCLNKKSRDQALSQFQV